VEVQTGVYPASSAINPKAGLHPLQRPWKNFAEITFEVFKLGLAKLIDEALHICRTGGKSLFRELLG
jgi:hypothetical protein